jgi:hygromycin-B 4-O-kinase
MNVDLAQAREFLADYLGAEPGDVELIGAGAWSRCFGFQRGGEELVIRFGNHMDDFEKDRLAHDYAAPGLPIPRVLDIGRVFNGYYAVSTRAHGDYMENIASDQWPAIVPALASALEAMRTADIAVAPGFGGWGVDGAAPQTSWSEHLLMVTNDTEDQRIHGWRTRLTHSLEGEAAFAWGFDLLRQVVSDAIPRSLLHCDLINRNVLVANGGISAVFDWGCSRYGDHLYDLAWFEFWAPWHTNLDMQRLRAELEQRWRDVGYIPENLDNRLTACYLHIGLDHLAYNAYLGNWETLAATARRMRALAADRH